MGHPVYEAGGPVCLFKAQKDHVTLGFWRGADMTGLEPRLVPHGGFQMASIKITKPGEIEDADIAPWVAAQSGKGLMEAIAFSGGSNSQLARCWR